jgi:hypothetical protein
MERKTAARWLIVFALACFGFFLFAGIASAQSGETTIQGSNSSTDASSDTGDATGENNSSFGAGPTATGSTGASSQQLGHNSAALKQSASAKSGDPVAGAQVTGAVADNVTVQNQNSAVNPSAFSGEADVENEAEDFFAGPVATTDTGTAQASQLGSNDLDVSQDAIAETGDAVAGSQVTGIVGDGEHTVSVQNSAVCDEETCAESGEAEVENEFEDATVGPFAATDGTETAQTAQVGDNDAVISQTSEANSGDALFGSEVIGIVGGSATVQGSNSSTCDIGDECAESGHSETENEVEAVTIGPSATSAAGTAQTMQTGDNAADISQDTSVSSGDALSGSQVLGAVGDDDGFLTEQLQQASDGDEVEAEEARGQNSVEDTVVGPFADADAQANASQMGDNDAVIDQRLASDSGDALAGSQVVGAVGFGTVTGQNSNSALSPFAITADDDGRAVDQFNKIEDSAVGPLATSATAGASVAQTGDNSAAASQDIAASTGDAVAGGQITGVVAGGSDVTIQNQQAVEDAEATSGDLPDLENEFDDFAVGPTADAVETAMAIQNGDNAFDGSQAIAADTGDAVAAGQVFGVVTGDSGTVTVSGSNACIDADGDDECAEAESGDIGDDDFENETDDLFVGPNADSDTSTASASQLGDNSAAVDQALDGHTGDAVAGSQVAGVVAGDGSDVTIQLQNSAEGAEAESGEIEEAENDLEANVGPTADADANAQAQQTGDNSLAFSQDIDVGSGDAVAGSQVTGVVGPENATVQVSNSDDASEAESGDVEDVENSAEGALGVSATSATANAMTQQDGDSEFDGAQDFAIDSGDAVAGSQINGSVGGTGLGLPGLDGG